MSRHTREVVHAAVTGAADQLAGTAGTAEAAAAINNSHTALRTAINTIMTTVFLDWHARGGDAVALQLELREKPPQPRSILSASSDDILKLLAGGLISKEEARELALRAIGAPAAICAGGGVV